MSEYKSSMKWYSSTLPTAFGITLWVSFAVVFIICLLDFAGWMFQIASFKSIVPHWLPMNIITSINLFLIASSLLIFQTNFKRTPLKILPQLFAIIICLVSLLTIYVHLYYAGTGHKSSLTDVTYLGFIFMQDQRMDLLLSCISLLFGFILILLSVDKKVTSGVAHIIIIPITLISYYLPVSYILGIYHYGEMDTIPIPLNSGIAFFAACIIVLLMRPDTWLLKVFTSGSLGGLIARRLIPAVMVIPVVIAWFRIRGERTGLFESETGVVLVAITYTVCFLILTWFLARSVTNIDKKRRVSEEALRESENKLWTILNATQESIYMFDSEGKITMSNSTGLERLKTSSGNDIIGHHFSEFMTPDTAKRRQAKLDEIFRTGKSQEFEDEHEGRTYRHNFSPVFIDGKVSYVVTYSTDITERKRADIKLKESEDRFRTIAESIPILISINRIKDSNTLFVNEHHEKTFGFEKGEMTGKGVFDIFYNPQDRKNLSGTLKEKGGTYNTEMKVKKADGTQFWIMASIRTIMFMNEPSFLTASIDITETKKAQEELLRLNRTLNAHNKSSHAMMHFGNELNYLNEVSKIIVEDCGYTMVWIGYAQNDKRKSVKPVAFYGFDKGYIDHMNIVWSNTKRGRGPTGTAIRTGKPSVCKNMLTDPAFEPWRKGALKRGYASSLVLPLISEGKSLGAISIYSKEPDSFSDNEIILLSDLADDLAYGISYIRLEDSERASTKVIKENEAQLKELIATKDKFFNIVAHDLKNPFTSLLGSSELLHNNIHKMSTENVKKLSLILNDSAKGGYAILQNLLDWSRSQTGLLKYNPEKINLKKLIDENISNLQLPAANKEISLFSETEEDIYIIADKNMIDTLLRNLLNNAIKFTHRHGEVIVGAITDTENVIISVKDTGIGISDEKIEKLFRIDTKHSMPGTENEQGTGLGLKLCKEFVEKMGGKIWVESVENKGSIFMFSIPVKEGRLP